MPYVSPAVESIRADPVAGESVTLLVRTADDADPDAVAAAAERAGGTVRDRLEFGSLLVAVEQPAVGALCELDGVGAVETDRTLVRDADGAPDSAARGLEDG